MATTVGGIRVRILGDDSDLQKKLGDSTKQLAKYGAAAAAAGAAAAAALTIQGLKAVDAQAKLARQLGTSIDSLRGLQIAASDAGVSSNVMTRALEQLNSRVGEAQRGTGAAADSFRRLGLNAKDLASMEADERMAAIADAMRNAGLSSSQMADELRQLGIRQGEVVNLMLSGGDAIRGYRKEVDDLGLSLSEVDAAKVEAANDAFSRMGMFVEGLQKQMAVESAPYLLAISKQVSEAVKDMGGLGQVAENVFDFIIRGAGFVADALHGWRVVIKGAEAAFQGLGVVGVEIGNSIVQSLDQAISGAREIINDLIRAANRLPGINMEELVVGQSEFAAKMQGAADSARETFKETQRELHELLMQPMPSESIERWVEGVREQAQIAAQAMVEAQQGGGGGMTEEEQKQQEALHKRLEDRLQSIREANMEEVELLNERFAAENEAIDQAYEERLINEQEWDQLMRDQKSRHEDELTDIEKRAADARQRVAEQEAQAKQRILSGAMSALTTLMNSESRKLFEIGKVAAISQSIISTYQGASEALKLGWPLGPIAAAEITTAGLANVAAIKSQSFGGGASGGGGGGGSVTQNVNAQSEAVQPREQTVANISLQGDTFGRDTVKSLMEQMNELADDGMRFNVV